MSLICKINNKNNTFFEWQKEAINYLRGKNGILSTPTGSGKTKVALEWSGLTSNGETVKQPDKLVIFTAPIKALSNQRYKELKKMGFNVGIETGDIKENTHANILCMTQEIFTLKYSNYINKEIYLIVDEFHYIAKDSKRARNYIDGLYNTRQNNNIHILLMSATFGKNQNELKQYLENITHKPFEVYKRGEEVKPTKTYYLGEDVKENYFNEEDMFRNSIVFLFSGKGIEGFAEELQHYRKSGDDILNSKQLEEVYKIAKKYYINPENLDECIQFKIGKYIGSLKPQTKKFYEELFEKGYINVMVGTDALSLGVNFPVEKVYFGQLAKFYDDDTISKNEFLQMAGRAGRKGYFDKGYVGYVMTDYENREFREEGYDTDDMYYDLLNKQKEDLNIKVDVDNKVLLQAIKNNYNKLFDFIKKELLKEIDIINETEGINDRKIERISDLDIKEKINRIISKNNISNLFSKKNLNLINNEINKQTLYNLPLIDEKRASEIIWSDVKRLIKEIFSIIFYKGNYSDSEKIIKNLFGFNRTNTHISEFDKYNKKYIEQRCIDVEINKLFAENGNKVLNNKDYYKNTIIEDRRSEGENILLLLNILFFDEFDIPTMFEWFGYFHVFYYLNNPISFKSLYSFIYNPTKPEGVNVNNMLQFRKYLNQLEGKIKDNKKVNRIINLKNNKKKLNQEIYEIDPTVFKI